MEWHEMPRISGDDVLIMRCGDAGDDRVCHIRVKSGCNGLGLQLAGDCSCRCVERDDPTFVGCDQTYKSWRKSVTLNRGSACFDGGAKVFRS